MATQYISLWADCQQVQNESSQQYRRCVCVCVCCNLGFTVSMQRRMPALPRHICRL